MGKIKQSVKAKVLTIMSLVLVVICVACCVIVAVINKNMRAALNDKYDLSNYAEQYRNTSEYLTSQARLYAVTGEREYYDNYWYEVNTARNRETSLARMQEIGITSDELALVNRAAEISNGAVPSEEKAMDLAAAGDTESAYKLLYSQEYNDTMSQVSDMIDQFNNAIQTRMQKKVDGLQIKSEIADAVTYVALCITFAAQILLMVFVLKELIMPIIKIKGKMEEFARGDIHKPMDMREDDTEIGMTVAAINHFQKYQMEIIDDINYFLSEMSEGNFVLETRCRGNYRGDYANILVSLEKINTELSSTLSNINQAFVQVDDGASQVSQASMSLSHRAAEQASSVEEISATINMISEMIKNNAQSSTEASGQSEIAGEELASTNEKMNDLVGAMNEINASSEEIRKIIKTIEDIALQTNILALNAAVEAARAGSVGKGFAVVADEVRNLANKSTEAAKNTAQMIQNNVDLIGKGNSLVGDVADKLRTVAETAAAVVDINERIVEASKEAAEAIVQASAGVEQISQVIQANAATSEETAAASEKLTNEARDCKELIGRFTLR